MSLARRLTSVASQDVSRDHRSRIGMWGAALRQRPLGQRLCQPVLGVPALIESRHLLVAEGRIQMAGFDEVVTGVQAQY